MSRESQTGQYKSLIASLEVASGFPLAEPKLFEVQPLPSAESTLYREILGDVLEDTDGYPTLGFPEQAPVRFDSLPVLQNVGSLAALGVFVAKADETSHSLAAVLDMLVSIISENRDELFASLTSHDCQRLTAARDRLIDIVVDDENHLLGSLIDFVNNLIKDRGAESDPSTHERRRPERRPERMGRPANRPRMKLTDLLSQEPEIVEDIQDVNAVVLKPRRPERVGRPANRPRLKLADLLARETEHIADEERDTGTVDSEAW